MAKVLKDSKERREQRKKRTGMLLSIFLCFVFILLMSSFVLRYVYRGAGSVSLTQEGVALIYRAAMGDTAFVNDQEENEEMNPDDQVDSYDQEDPYMQEDNAEYYTDGSGVYNQDGSNTSQEQMQNSTESRENSQNSRESQENSQNSRASQENTQNSESN